MATVLIQAGKFRIIVDASRLEHDLAQLFATAPVEFAYLHVGDCKVGSQMPCTCEPEVRFNKRVVA